MPSAAAYARIVTYARWEVHHVGVGDPLLGTRVYTQRLVTRKVDRSEP